MDGGHIRAKTCGFKPKFGLITVGFGTDTPLLQLILRGRKMILQPFAENDFAELLSWFSNEKELTQWAGPTIFYWPLDRRQLSEYLSKTLGEKPRTLVFRCIDEDLKHVIGYVELFLILIMMKRKHFCHELL